MRDAVGALDFFGANRIEYQLKATDTRDPGPQTALSARQMIETFLQWPF